MVKRITLNVKPNSKKTGVERITDSEWIVRVGAAPADGKANREVIERVAEELGVPKSQVTLLHGQKGRRKIVEVK